jgi:hypothetical protein
MACRVMFVIEGRLVQPNETLVPLHQETQRILLSRYDSVLSTCNINLHYVAQRGYHVAAFRQPLSSLAYRPGDDFKTPQPTDITTDVEQVLRNAGIQVF